jgi:hypothetical protein
MIRKVLRAIRDWLRSLTMSKTGTCEHGIPFTDHCWKCWAW